MQWSPATAPLGKLAAPIQKLDLSHPSFPLPHICPKTKLNPLQKMSMTSSTTSMIKSKEWKRNSNQSKISTSTLRTPSMTSKRKSKDSKPYPTGPKTWSAGSTRTSSTQPHTHTQKSLWEWMSSPPQGQALLKRLEPRTPHHQVEPGTSNPWEVPLPLAHRLQGHQSLQE